MIQLQKHPTLAIEEASESGRKRMNRIEEALMRSNDCVEIIGMDGRVIATNSTDTSSCGDLEEQDEGWVMQWPETSRTSVQIGLEEALDGRKHRFEAYRPRNGQDAWWDVSVTSIEDEKGVSGALAVSRDITRIRNEQMQSQAMLEEARSTAEERDLISREMRHRLKNQITAIRSLALMTARDHPDTKSFMDSFNRRMMSLSTSQDILSARDNQPVELNQAIQSILAATGRSRQVTISSMPQATVGPQALATMALILGELSTNALKYGALSEDQGTVRIECQEKEGILTFTWDEDSGVPIVPGDTGSGHQLMKRMSANSGVDFILEWLETGLLCQFGINSRAIG